MPKKRVTIRDVARVAGVTHPTVSRAIHNDERVSAETKKRINKAIRQLGYRPNLIARSLVNSKTRTIGLIVPELNPHVHPFVRGVSKVCSLHDYALMLFSTDYWQEERSSFFHIVDNWRVDGVLIYNVVYHEQYRKEIRQAKASPTPFVFIDKYLDQKNVNSVGVDNMQSIRMILEYLVELGHTRIGLMDGSPRSVDGHERHEAFINGLKEFNLSYRKQFCGVAHYSDQQAYDEMKHILSYKRHPTAMVCVDDIPENRFFKPALTTIRPPHEEAAEKATEHLFHLINTPGSKYRQIALDAQLIIRDSTGVVPGKKKRG